MTEKGNEQEKKHALSMGARRHISISGVTEVESFDEQTVILSTDCGEMTLEGEGLHIGTLDIARGVVEVDGKVNGLYYSDSAPARRGLRAKLFG
ncbi:MAG: sporulation protein YabP [Clostridia bacterium]|nr:sporulation protein YabP [Clostridia bacterium]MBQ8716733.1 sporulation protein YabP [Clostridia bacterium]